MRNESNPQKQAAALTEQLSGIATLLKAFSTGIAGITFAPDVAGNESCNVTMVLSAIRCEVDKLFEPEIHGEIVDDSAVYERLCHLQGMLILLQMGVDGIDLDGEGREGATTHEDITRMVRLLVTSFDGLRKLIDWKTRNNATSEGNLT